MEVTDEFRDKWPEMRMKHLELVQNAITRMGANNANLKGYCMTMVAAVIGLSAAVSKEQIILYTLPLVLAFAVLDSAYLALERGFRNHFDSVRKQELDARPDFHIYPEYSGFIGCFFSWSVAGFYGSIAIIMTTIYCVMPDIVKST
jgi:hypothetical protein